MLARIGVHPPAKVSRQLAQSLFCQRCVGKELVPPGQQPSAGLPQRMIPAHRNAISAVVGALKSIGQVARQVVCSCHVLRLSKPAVRRQANLFFPALSGKKCVLLFPIDWPEPFGLVLIEAMACGTPVIAYRCGSVPELVDDGVTGFVVEDLDAATEAVSKIRTLDRALCRHRFEERFSATRMAEEYLAIYRRLMNTESQTTSH